MLKRLQNRYELAAEESSDEEIPREEQSKEGSKQDDESPVRKQNEEERPPSAEIALIPIQPEPEQLQPKYSVSEAAFMIQGIYRCMKAHQGVIGLIQNQYRKVYSLHTGRYMYTHVGIVNAQSGRRVHSKLVEPVTISYKPINLFSKDLKITFTRDLTTMRIQRFARFCNSIKRARALARQLWLRKFDPISGSYFYWFPRLKVKKWSKPKIIGCERWNPMDITKWNEQDGRHYFRKIGLSRHGVHSKLHELGINGELLLSLDMYDVLNLEIPQKIADTILAEIGQDNYFSHSSETLRRREVLRLHCNLIQCAVTIQKSFRRFLYASKLDRCVNLIQRNRHKQITSNDSCWYTGKNIQFMVVSEGSTKRKTYIIEG